MVDWGLSQASFERKESLKFKELEHVPKSRTIFLEHALDETKQLFSGATECCHGPTALAFRPAQMRCLCRCPRASAWIVIEASFGWLGERPIMEAIHQSGLWAVRLLAVTLR